MSSQSKGLSLSPGTVLTVVCLLLYSAGFIRIELKFSDHDQRLTAVEEVISQMKHGLADTWNKGKLLMVSGNCNLNIKPPSSSTNNLSIVSLYYTKRAIVSRKKMMRFNFRLEFLQ